MSVIHLTSKSSLDQIVAEMDRRGTVIEQLEARIRALEAIPQGAIDALRKNQRQLDMDGCEVGVSRQAIDEVLTGLDAALASLAPQGETSHGVNPAQVTDEGVQIAVIAYNTTFPGSLANKEQMRAALTTAIGAGAEDPRWQKLRNLFGLDGWHEGLWSGIPNPDQIVNHVEHIANERARLLKAHIDGQPEATIVAGGQPVAGEPVANLRLILARLGELNRDDEAGIRIVLANVIDALVNPAQMMDAGDGRYRKKPVVIEAKQFIGGPDSAVECMSFAGLPETAYVHLDGGVEYLHIGTLEGIMRANVDDWIIRGVQGEFYPCKPDIFEATYEPALTAAIGAGGQAVASEEIGWLIEHGGSDKPIYWQGGGKWSDNHESAIRFAREQDAATIALKLSFERGEELPSHKAVEHAWSGVRVLSAFTQPHPADERVVEALRAAYEKVKLWPENRMPGVDVTELGEGFMDLLALRNLIPGVLAALSAKEGR